MDDWRACALIIWASFALPDVAVVSGFQNQVRQKVMDSIQPVVVPVGGDDSDLREKVKRAIGVDLYKTEDE